MYVYRYTDIRIYSYSVYFTYKQHTCLVQLWFSDFELIAISGTIHIVVVYTGLQVCM